MEEAREAAPSRPREQATDDGDSFGSGLLAPAIPTPTAAERVLADDPVRRILPFNEPYHSNMQPHYCTESSVVSKNVKYGIGFRCLNRLKGSI